MRIYEAQADARGDRDGAVSFSSHIRDDDTPRATCDWRRGRAEDARIWFARLAPPVSAGASTGPVGKDSGRRASAAAAFQRLEPRHARNPNDLGEGGESSCRGHA